MDINIKPSLREKSGAGYVNMYKSERYNILLFFVAIEKNEKNRNSFDGSGGGRQLHSARKIRNTG